MGSKRVWIGLDWLVLIGIVGVSFIIGYYYGHSDMGVVASLQSAGRLLCGKDYNVLVNSSFWGAWVYCVKDGLVVKTYWCDRVPGSGKIAWSCARDD